MMRDTKPWDALALRFPEQIVLVVCKGHEGPANVITIGWFMPASADPPMVAVAVGKTRYSHRLIEEGREFVVAFPPQELHDAMLLCGTRSGRDVDKIEAAGLRTAPAKRVGIPLLSDCAGNLECRLAHAYDAGDHTIFVGEILAAHTNPDAGRILYTLRDGDYGPISG
jgi:flavin reductase (DIM6/NTAB) family NADH-FMN oxidoreductase RutF